MTYRLYTKTRNRIVCSRIDEETYQELEKLCQELRIDKSLLIMLTILYVLEHQENFLEWIIKKIEEERKKLL